ncbi:MAG: hypothetical protein AABM29_06120 [Actinomycetota bacterium]
MAFCAPTTNSYRRLVLVLLMLAYSAAFDLDSAAEWIVLGAICFLAVGAMVAVHGGRRA